MKFCNETQHLTLFRQKVYLPKNMKKQDLIDFRLKEQGKAVLRNTKPENEGDVVFSIFSLNNSYKDTMNLFKSTSIIKTMSYKDYYFDYIYMGKIGNLPIHKYRIKKQREEIYKTIKSEFKQFKCDNTFKQLKNKNCYVDLFVHNNIFFKKAIQMTNTLKYKAYIEFLKKILNDERFNDHERMVMVDLSSWLDNTKMQIKLDNPVMIFYYCMWKNPDLFKSIGDIDFIFYLNNQNKMIRVNPSLCDKDSFKVFKREMAKISSIFEAIDKDEATFDKCIATEDAVVEKVNKELGGKKYFTGGKDDPEDSEFSDEVNTVLADKVNSKIAPKVIKGEEISDIEIDNIIEEVKKDKDTISRLVDIIDKKNQGKSNASIARDKELRENQKKIKIENVGTIDELADLERDLTPPVIAVDDVFEDLSTINKNVTKMRFRNFDKTYNNKLYKKDVVNTFSSLANKSMPAYIRDINYEDTSDKMNYKETWTVHLEDTNRNRHTIVVDMPKFIDDKYMYLGGNQKYIDRQFFNKPIIKSGPNTVQITTNYNKIFMGRAGDKVSGYSEAVKKYLLEGSNKNIVIKFGNCFKDNKSYKTNLAYTELGKVFKSVSIPTKTGGKDIYMFSQPDIEKFMEEKSIKNTTPPEYICYGFSYSNGHYSCMSADPDVDSSVDVYMYNSINRIDPAALPSINGVGKKFMYTEATMMSKTIPLIVVLGFYEGLSTVLRKTKSKYRFADAKPENELTEAYVEFADGYLVYDRNDVSMGLLMNAFYNLDTKSHKIEEYDEKDVYLDILENRYGARNIGVAFMNFYEGMIDHITLEMLNVLHYPTDLVSLMLFGNKLLIDESYIIEQNANNVRIRGNEVCAALLYKEIITAYGRYFATASNKKPVKISVPRDIVLKKLKLLTTVEDASIINPIYSADKERNVTSKGANGMNLDESYTIDKRCFDPTMLGVCAISSSPDANVGKMRTLTMEPNIINARGFIDIKNDDLDELKDANLFSVAEMLTPIGAAQDESIRTAMSSKQSKHIIPTTKSSPVLISNGAEQVIQYQTTSDFAIIADEDGEVVEYNEKLKLMIVQYNSGKYRAIDLNPKTVKNGAGGFFLENQLETKYKLGDKVKKNDIIATDTHFFSNDLYGNRFNLGTLEKVACMSSDSTFEDSSIVSQKMAEDMATEMVMRTKVIVGKNSTVDFMMKVGDEVSVDQQLIRYEESFDEDQLNVFLSTVGADLAEDIKNRGKRDEVSHYKGVISDIKIYAGCEPEEMSDSLNTIVTKYYKGIKSKENLLNKYDKESSLVKCGLLMNEPTSKVTDDYGKIKGEEIGDGVLIEFYIKVHARLKVGDKITFYGPLKTTVGNITPKGQEMWSTYRPDEEVSSLLAPNSVLQRKVPSILKVMLLNKLLVELTRQTVDIYKKGKK